MANRNQVFGQATIKHDGLVLDTDKGATLDIGGVSREAVEGDFDASGFQEGTKPSKLDYSAFIKPGTRVADLRNIDNATVTFETDTGQTWMISGAYHAEPPVINQSDGKVSGSLMGPPAEELS
jgi:Phage tail tube protein